MGCAGQGELDTIMSGPTHPLKNLLVNTCSHPQFQQVNNYPPRLQIFLW